LRHRGFHVSDCPRGHCGLSLACSSTVDICSQRPMHHCMYKRKHELTAVNTITDVMRQLGICFIQAMQPRITLSETKFNSRVTESTYTRPNEKLFSSSKTIPDSQILGTFTAAFSSHFRRCFRFCFRVHVELTATHHHPCMGCPHGDSSSGETMGPFRQGRSLITLKGSPRHEFAIVP
jgi:hypothetical protein